MSIADYQRRVALAREILLQLDTVAQRLEDAAPIARMRRFNMRDAAVLKQQLVGMRDTADDVLAFGAAMRRFCDLVEPTLEDL